jgi:hypothetical protein
VNEQDWLFRVVCFITVQVIFGINMCESLCLISEIGQSVSMRYVCYYVIECDMVDVISYLIVWLIMRVMVFVCWIGLDWIVRFSVFAWLGLFAVVLSVARLDYPAWWRCGLWELMFVCIIWLYSKIVWSALYAFTQIVLRVMLADNSFGWVFAIVCDLIRLTLHSIYPRTCG